MKAPNTLSLRTLNKFSCYLTFARQKIAFLQDSKFPLSVFPFGNKKYPAFITNTIFHQVVQISDNLSRTYTITASITSIIESLILAQNENFTFRKFSSQ